MKVPSDKKLIDLYCHVDGEYLPLLSFLKKELPKGVSLEDVVLTETYYPSDFYDPEGIGGHSELRLGYLISKKDHDKQILKKKIIEEQEELADLEKELKSKRAELATKLAKLRKEDR